MKKLDLTDWAAISEIIGTAAVVISLVLVVHSINSNTDAMQVTNENFLYELTDSSLESIVSNPEIAAIFLKDKQNLELSEYENLIANFHFMRLMNRWNLAFDRHQDGMFATDKWEAWNENYVSVVDEDYLRKWWATNRAGYGGAFAAHIDSVISDE